MGVYGGKVPKLTKAPVFGGRRRLYEDGCEKADMELGSVSSCLSCPFDECCDERSGYRRVDRRIRVVVVDDFPVVDGISGIRPQLNEKDLGLILNGLREYSKKYPEEKKSCLALLHRILRKQVFFPGRWWFDKS